MTVNDIRTALCGLLGGISPTAMVYEDDLPRGFARPSYLVETIRTARRKATNSIMSVTVDMLVTCFPTVDAFDNARQEDITAMQEDVMRLFDGGYIPVGDRAPAVTVSTGGVDADAGYIDLSVEYSAPASAAAENYDLMDTVSIETEIQEV